MPEPRILLYDLETSFNVVAVFQLGNNDWINPENIIAERHIISFAYKWLGEDEVGAVSVLDNPKLFKRNPHDDSHVCKELHKLISQADVIVAHNGDKFDIKFAEARMLINGLEPLPPVQKIDTLKVAKNRFLFNSNKLDYLGNVLKVGRKLETTPGLWLEVLKGNRAAIEKMVEYNKGDVELLERVFLKLRPYMDNHINRELLGLDGCPRCGSKKVQSRGFHRAISRTYRRFHCQGCGGWHRAVVNEKEVKTSSRLL